MKFIKIVTIFLIAAFCGCATRYDARVVKKAREYVLENMPELSEKNRHCVKYSPPKLMQKLILAREITAKGSKKDVMQTCVVWADQDHENTYIVVAGVSERRLDDWYPIRLLIKSGDDWEIDETGKEAGKNK